MEECSLHLGMYLDHLLPQLSSIHDRRVGRYSIECNTVYRVLCIRPLRYIRRVLQHVVSVAILLKLISDVSGMISWCIIGCQLMPRRLRSFKHGGARRLHGHGRNFRVGRPISVRAAESAVHTCEPARGRHVRADLVADTLVHFPKLLAHLTTTRGVARRARRAARREALRMEGRRLSRVPRAPRAHRRSRPPLHRARSATSAPTRPPRRPAPPRARTSQRVRPCRSSHDRSRGRGRGAPGGDNAG